MFGGEQAQQIGHQRHVEDGDNSNMQRAAQLPWFAAYFLEKILELTKNRAGVLLKNQAGRGEENAFSPPLKERHTKAGLQVAHLLGNARLGNSETVRRAAEAAGFGHRQEVAQMPDLERVVHRQRNLKYSNNLCLWKENLCYLDNFPAICKGKNMTFAKPITAAALTVLFLTGCKGARRSLGASNKVRVGYIGLTCEAPIFSAVEKGFFKEEGLEVEMVKCEWANYKDVLALGGFDITHHLVMYFLKPIEQGLDVKFTGIHKGCLRVQASTKGNIHSVQDLRGKRIGVPGMGTPPFIFANRVLGANGIDASKDVTWRVFPAGELGLALDKGEVDAVADSEPIGSLLLADGKVRNVADQAADAPYKDEYCCAVIVNGKYLTANPKAAAAATRAPQRRQVGRGESGRGGAVVGRKNISRRTRS